MSKEQVIGFLQSAAQNEELRAKVSDPLDRYKPVDINSVDFNNSMIHNILPLAKEAGFDFTLEELKGVLSVRKEELSEEELDNVTAGRGQTPIQTLDMGIYGYVQFIEFCDKAPNDIFLNAMYNQTSNNQCPFYEFEGKGDNNGTCKACSRLHPQIIPH